MTSTVASTGYAVARRHLLAGLDGALESAARSAAALLPTVLCRPVPVVRLHGGGRSVLVAGEHPATAFVCRALLGAEVERESLQSVSPWRLPEVLPSLAGGVDLVIARTPRLLAERLFSDSWLRLPEAANARLRVPAAGVAVRWPDKAAYNVRRVRKGGFGWTVSADSSDFEQFFDTMLVPYVTLRHGDNAVVPSRQAMRRRFRRGGILWIERDGERVAGSVIEIAGDTLRQWALGARGGNEEWVRAGAFSALYVFGTEYARSMGLTWYDLGGGPPSPADGPMHHKLSWGAEICARPESRHDLVLHWPAGREDQAGFLAAAPLFVRDGSGLSLLLDAGGSDHVAALTRYYANRRLRRVYVLNAAANPAAGNGGFIRAIGSGWQGNPLNQVTCP